MQNINKYHVYIKDESSPTGIRFVSNIFVCVGHRKRVK